jgi:hypothetical protein
MRFNLIAANIIAANAGEINCAFQNGKTCVGDRRKYQMFQNM